MSRWAERSVDVWHSRCDYHSFAPMNPSGSTCWLRPSLALLCLSALFSTVDDIHPANPFPYWCYLIVTKMTFVSPLQRQTYYPCIKPDWEQAVFFLSLISSVFYIIIIWQVLSQIVSLVSKLWRNAFSLWSSDTLQHPFCGENADDHLPRHRTHDFQRFSVDCGSVGLTCVWEVREDLWVYCWMYRAIYVFWYSILSNTGVYTELYCTLMLLLQKQIQSSLLSNTT